MSATDFGNMIHMNVMTKNDLQQNPIRPELMPALLAWYDQGHRDLPWRRDASPYHVWISEIMLQQTRVEAVKEYYHRFCIELPDLESLARASEERLLKLWEGLGYYSRVRNLQKAAQRIVDDYDGKMPAKKEELLTLPGIGSYTASAISSICFNEPNPAVDGNVLRILARVRKDTRDISMDKVKKSVEEELRTYFPLDRCGDCNQAMMELGATVCTPNGQPHCSQCPWKEYCLSLQDQSYMSYPVKKKKEPRKLQKKTILIIQDKERMAISKRPEKGLLAGLYEYPSLEGHLSAQEVHKYILSQGMKVIRIEELPNAKHIFSHIEWHMQGYFIYVDELEPRTSGEVSDSWIFVEPREIRDKYPIPSAFEKYTKYILEGLIQE